MSKSNSQSDLVKGVGQNSPGKAVADPLMDFKFLFNKTFYYGAVILVLTFISFFPSLKGDFMQTWDDEKYVTANPVIRELNAGTIRQMFTRPVNGTYVPLPLLTYAVNYKLSGDSPMPFHATSLFFHLLSTLLVFMILRLLNIDLLYAAFGALLFGIHPMRIESVAWISERKDVMYGFFYLAAVFAYIRYLNDPARRPKLLLYSILLFLGALLSKIEAVTLPLTLLLVDYILKRPYSIRLLKEKIPYFALSLFFGLLGIFIIYRIGLHTPEFLKTNKDISISERFFYGL